MMLRGFKTAALLLLTLTMISVSSPTQAGWIKDILTDPLKLGKLSDGAQASVHEIGAIVDRLNSYLTTIQNRMDADVMKYIDETNKIIDKINADIDHQVDHVEAAITTTLTQVRATEQGVMEDVFKLIQCSEELTKVNLNEALAGAINKIAAARPCFSLFGWCVMSFDMSPQDVKDPIETYNMVMKAYRDRINGVKETDSPLIISNSLAEMQRITLQVLCLYDKTTAKPMLLRTFAELQHEAEPWVGYADFTMKNYVK